MDFEIVSSKDGDKSSVWHYFLRNKNKGEAKCKRCEKVLKTGGGSTSSLQRHLKSIHKIDLEAARPPHTTPSTSVSVENPEVPIKKTKLTHYYDSEANPSMPVMVSRMSAIDGISLRTFAKSQDLRRLFEKSGFKLPTTADTIRNIIMKEYNKRKQDITDEIKKKILGEKKFSISFDEWTSNRNRRYIGLTLHSPDFSRNCGFYNLGLIRINGSMNAACCVNLIETKLTQYGISLTNDIIAQTTDGCSLMVAFGKKLMSFHQLCIAHGIQLAILDVMYKRSKENPAPETPQEQGEDDDDNLPLSIIAEMQRSRDFNEDTHSIDDDEDGADFDNESLQQQNCFTSQDTDYYHQNLLSKVRKVVKIFKNSPTKNDDVLQKHVQSDFGREYSLILDGKTRWSSISEMLARFIKLKTSIIKALIDLKTDIIITDEDWKNMDELHKILDVIKTVVDALCRRDATILTADVSIKFAMKKMEEMNTPLSKKMAEALRKQYFKRRLPQTATLQYLTSPNKYFQNAQYEEKEGFYRPVGDRMLHDIVNIIKRTSKQQYTPLEHAPNQDLQELSNTTVSTLTNEEELNKELSQATTSEIESDSQTDDLLNTVRVEMALFENGGQRQRGQYLSLVYEYLKTIPPTSVEPERIFSSAGIVCNRLRSSLSDKTLDALIFLRSYYLSAKKN